MITFQQARKILEEGERLMDELRAVDGAIARYEAVPGELVRCRAFPAAPGVEARGAGDYGRMFDAVDLLPVAKSMVLSTLQRDRSKIVGKLAELGVDAGAELTMDANGDMVR